MPPQQLIIAPAARTDLRDIYQYGLRQWGQAQSDSYLENMKDKFWSLTEQPLMGVERPELLPGIRSLPVESHIVFLRILAIPITDSGFIRSPDLPNTLGVIVSLRVIGISHIRHHFSHRFSFEF